MLLQDGQAPSIVLETGRVEGQIGVHTARNMPEATRQPIQLPRSAILLSLAPGAISK